MIASIATCRCTHAHKHFFLPRTHRNFGSMQKYVIIVQELQNPMHICDQCSTCKVCCASQAPCYPLHAIELRKSVGCSSSCDRAQSHTHKHIFVVRFKHCSANCFMIRTHCFHQELRVVMLQCSSEAIGIIPFTLFYWRIGNASK